jgi:hypothetical protein
MSALGHKQTFAGHAPITRRSLHHIVEKFGLLLCAQLVERLEHQADLFSVFGFRVHFLKPIHQRGIRDLAASPEIRYSGLIQKMTATP